MYSVLTLSRPHCVWYIHLITYHVVFSLLYIFPAYFLFGFSFGRGKSFTEQNSKIVTFMCSAEKLSSINCRKCFPRPYHVMKNWALLNSTFFLFPFFTNMTIWPRHMSTIWIQDIKLVGAQAALMKTTLWHSHFSLFQTFFSQCIYNMISYCATSGSAPNTVAIYTKLSH